MSETTQLPTLEINEPLRITVCPTCLMAHAMPRLAFARAESDRAPIYCAKGHSYIPGTRDEDGSTALETAVELQAQLHDQRAQYAALALRLAAYEKAAGGLSKAEILRRARILADRASAASKIGDPACPICGNSKARFALVSHLRRSHAAELQRMDQSAFQ